MDLDTLLNASLAEDFSSATTAFPFTPGGTTAPAGGTVIPPAGAEDIVGHVANLSLSGNTFTLTNAQASYNLKVDGTTTFFQFSCATPGISCLQNNQILSVDIAIQSDGSLLARNIVFEDPDSSDAEVEGIVTSTDALNQQFNVVVHTVSGSGTGLSVGQKASVQYAAQTSFAIDLLHADSTPISPGFLFSTPTTDLIVGQEVSIRRNPASVGGQIQADRVLLRSTRFTANISTIGSGIISLPSSSLISGHNGGATVLVHTFAPTILFEIGHTITLSNIGPPELISSRGPLFNVSGQRTLAASKVVVQP